MSAKNSKISVILIIIHCIIALLMLAVFLNKFIAPKTISCFGFLSLVFPVLFIVNLIFTLFWLVERKRFSIIFLIITVLLFFPIQKYVHFWKKYDGKNIPNTLKIITYNTNYGNKGKNLKELDEYVLKQDADIVFFQEIYTRQWRSSETLLTNRYNAIFDLVGISSKYPIVNKQKIILPGKGYACFADIQREDDTLRCFNLYLEPMSLKKSLFHMENADDAASKTKAVTEKLSVGFKKHQVQADILSRYIKTSPYPVIVCGDFNSVPMSYEYFLIKDDLQDVFEAGGRGWGMTFYDYFYPIRIDYIFVDGDRFVPKDCYVDKNVKLSDHYPVVAEIQLK